MKWMRSAAVTFLFVMSTSAPASPATDCASAVAHAQSLNGTALFESAAKCGESGQSDHAHLLMIAAQIRGVVDLALFKTGSAEAEQAAGTLAGLLWSAGGAGDPTLYRDKARADRLLTDLRAWNPVLAPDYDPGWRYKRWPSRGRFDALISDAKNARLAQIEDYRELIQDPEYFTAQQSLAQLQREHPKGFDANSESGKRASALMASMSRIAESFQKRARAFAPSASPAPDVDPDFRRLHAGFNGPSRAGAFVYVDGKQARGSWLARALAPLEMERVLAGIDFGKEVLVALAFGERTNALGTVELSEIEYSHLADGLHVSGSVGVADDNCVVESARSYPFAVAAAPRPIGSSESRGFSISNFPDKCGPARNGTSSDP